jgi:hypothetical protein
MVIKGKSLVFGGVFFCVRTGRVGVSHESRAIENQSLIGARASVRRLNIVPFCPLQIEGEPGTGGEKLRTVFI